ncbi:ricin-type beta-trefoil lectin protein [Bacillus thuringiensis]
MQLQNKYEGFEKEKLCAQKCEFVYDRNNNVYQIKSVYDSNLILAWIDVPDSDKVMAHPNEYKKEHYWYLEETSDGYFIIKNLKNMNFVLDVDGADPNNGTRIKVNNRHPDYSEHINAQKFKLITLPQRAHNQSEQELNIN